MDGVTRIDKVVANLEVWLDSTFPFAKMKVKVIQRSPADFLAVPNLAWRNAATNEVEYTSGLGGDAEEAVRDLLERFVSEIRDYSSDRPMTEADFEWSAPEDF